MKQLELSLNDNKNQIETITRILDRALERANAAVNERGSRRETYRHLSMLEHLKIEVDRLTP